jgi:hypothetical protein
MAKKIFETKPEDRQDIRNSKSEISVNFRDLKVKIWRQNANNRRKGISVLQ